MNGVFDNVLFFKLAPSNRRAWLGHCTVSMLAGAAPAVLAAPGDTRRGATSDKPVILIVGDSLSAEYGLQRGSGWVALLEQRLARESIDARVVNASISGETTSGGRSRMLALLKTHRPTHVVIELGGNDALRGLPASGTEANLRAMVQAARGAGAEVLIAGMQIPPNYGRKFAESFSAAFSNVAKSEKVALLPFLLAGVADIPNAERYFQPDRIHPSASAQTLILDNVWPVLLPMLKR